MAEAEIRAKYKTLHDSETLLHYAGEDGRTKEEWDIRNGKIWIDMEAELIAEGYIQPPKPLRDAFAEIDELRAEIIKLKK